jgi:hypothetical protein
VQCRVLIRLTLQPEHWRRHDRAFWLQTIAAAVDSAAPGRMRVETYEVRDMMVVVRVRVNGSLKQVSKLMRDDLSFHRLTARLVDLGAEPELELEGEAP